MENPICTTGLALNTLKPPFDNKDVRWALTLAIDIVSYSITAYDGAVEVSAIPCTPKPLYNEYYYEPMQEWLKDFTLDLGNGETFKPYDPDVPNKLAEHAKLRGHEVTTDLKETFGYGWWKYAPFAAAKLLEKNGFTQDKDGKWLLPDGTPWKITITTIPHLTTPQYRNAVAAEREWKKFGIDVEVMAAEVAGSIMQRGEYEVGTDWPCREPLGGHPDLFMVFDSWNSAYLEPVLGEPHYGQTSRWTDPRMDEIITKLKEARWDDTDRIAELGIEGLKLATEEMTSIWTFAYAHVIVWDTYYWTNWPGAENPYSIPHLHWGTGKYMLTHLKPTGR
ncbi:hypothetical protein ES703_120647 [subsurface metagenome]